MNNDLLLHCRRLSKPKWVFTQNNNEQIKILQDNGSIIAD